MEEICTKWKKKKESTPFILNKIYADFYKSNMLGLTKGWHHRRLEGQHQRNEWESKKACKTGFGETGDPELHWHSSSYSL